MSDRFRNVVFLVCVSATFLVVGLNLLTMKTVQNTFSSLYNEAAKAQQIMVAQDYAMSTASIAEHQTQKVHELEERLEMAFQQYIQVVEANQQMSFQSAMNEMALRAQGAYIEQLREYIADHDLPVPVPDLNRVQEPTPAPQCDENGCPVNPKDAAPLIEIELIEPKDTDGNDD